MQDYSLQAQLAEAKTEIARLRERLFREVPTVHKDLYLFSQVLRYSGAESAILWKSL
jgi:hypothetical protein